MRVPFSRSLGRSNRDGIPRGRVIVGWMILCALTQVGCGPRQSSTQRFNDEDVMFPDEREAAEARHPASATVAAGERKLAGGDLGGAQRDFEAALEENPRDARALLNLGLVLELGNHYEEAEARYLAALEVDPEFPEALNNLGLLYRDRERFPEAIAMLDRAIAARPAYGEAWLNMAFAREESGDLEGAREAYARTVTLLSDDAGARTNYGLLLLRLEDTDAAAIEFQRAARLATGEQEGDAELLEAVAAGLRRCERHAEAASALRRLVRVAPSAPRHTALGLALHAAGEEEAALSALRDAVAADETFAAAHFYLGSLLARAGDREAATTHLQRYLALDPDGRQSERARTHLQSLSE